MVVTKMPMLKPLFAVLLLAAACSITPSSEDSPPVGMTKEEARASGGWWPHPGTNDVCAWYGWYGDGKCDEFCPLEDPDCDFPTQCGTSGGVGAPTTECDGNEWCDHAYSGCGFAGNTLGVCKPRPTHCSGIYYPVCGCDGNTYFNWCYATAAGTDVFHNGTCFDPIPDPDPNDPPPPPPPSEDCTSDADCPSFRRCTAGEEDCDPDPNCPLGAACDTECWGKCVPGAHDGQSCEGNCEGRSEDDSCGCSYECAWDGDCCADYAAFCWD